jgi:two-component system LytT family response regulator
MITTLIIDDEAAARKTLRELLAAHLPEIQVQEEAASVADGIALINQHSPELVFLDVQMPDGTGFDLLGSLPEISFKTIFVSAFDVFAINAFKYSAIDYLLKPVDANDLIRAVEKLKSPDDQRHQKIKVLLGNRKAIEKIALPSLEELFFVRPDEIIRCQADNNYTRFYMKSGQNILVCKTLKDYEELLEPLGFFRIHKSDLINLHYLKKYKRGEGGTVTLDDGTQLEVSRRRKDDFLRAIQL